MTSTLCPALPCARACPPAPLPSARRAASQKGGVRALQDEVVASHGVPFDKYAAVVKRLRALLGPDALLVANEGSDLMDWNLTAHSGPPEIRVAPELDLFSLDFYDGWNTDGEWEVDMVRGIYEASVFPQLLPHQKAVLVPYNSDTFSSLFTVHLAKPKVSLMQGHVWMPRLDRPRAAGSADRQEAGGVLALGRGGLSDRVRPCSSVSARVFVTRKRRPATAGFRRGTSAIARAQPRASIGARGGRVESSGRRIRSAAPPAPSSARTATTASPRAARAAASSARRRRSAPGTVATG